MSAAGNQYEAVYGYLRKVVSERLEMNKELLMHLQPGTPIVEGLQLDSLAQVTLLAAIEDDLGVVLEPEDRGRIHTVDDLVRLTLERSSRGVPCE